MTPTKLRILVVFMLCVCCHIAVQGAQATAPAPLIPAAAWAGALKGAHPRLLGPKTHLEERRKAFPQYYEMMKTNDSIIAAGVVNALDGVDKAKIDNFIEAAKAKLLAPA